MPDKKRQTIQFNLASLGQIIPPSNPGPGWVGPERPAESWADVAADPISALFDVGRGAVTGDAPAGMNLQGLGALIAAAMPVAGGAKALRAATKAAKISELADEAAQQSIKAYHGSPHDFDQFSMSKIGTGEGAQAYGHGLYFAENPGVASDYQRKLSKFGHASEMPEDMATSILLDGKVVNGSTPSNKLTPLERAALTKHYSGGQAQAVRDLEESLKYMTPGTEAYEGDKATLDVLKSTDLTGRVQPFKGRMYEVQIHASPDQFLDWDKPLSQQSETVQKAARQFVKQGNGGYFTGDQFLGKDPTGKQIYDAAHDYREMLFQRQHVVPAGREGATDALKAQGIPGIRYLDAGSRGGNRDAWLVTSPSGMVRQFTNEAEAKAAHGTIGGTLTAPTASRNFVIFDDSLVSILKKYGVALPVIEGLRERAKQNGGVISRQDVDALQ